MEKADILNSTHDGLDVFRHYIPGNWRLGKPFLNPFYKDTHASFNIFYDKQAGVYLMKDFGNSDYEGDCFTLVAMLNGRSCADKKDFVNVMETIAHDMNLFLPVKAGHNCAPSTPVSPTRSSIAAHERAFTSAELDWWKAYGIAPEVLEHYHVIAISRIDFASYSRQTTAAEPTFLYRFSTGELCTQKLYSPCSRNRFVYINKVEGQLFGFEHLPSKGVTVVLTGGEKDVLTLAALGIPAFCLNSETAVPDEALIKGLKERFERVVVMFDSDETGMRCSRKLCTLYDLQRLCLPLAGTKAEKDISDYVKRQLAVGIPLGDIKAQLCQWLNEAKTETDKEMEPYMIRFSAPPVKPERVLSIGFQSVASAGGLVCITGGPGTGKSNYAAAILSGTLNTVLNGEMDTLGIRVSPNVERKAVLLFDTEQSEFQSFCNLERILGRAGVVSQPEHLQVMNLCRMPRRDRQAFIEKALKQASARCNGVYCMVIDGLADLIGSANDEDEAVRIVEWAQGLAEAYHMVLISVVHTAGLPEKVRGHLGSELTRKASAVIDIEVDKKSGHSLVKVLKLREGSAREAGVTIFGWNEKQGMHVSCA